MHHVNKWKAHLAASNARFSRWFSLTVAKYMEGVKKFYTFSRGEPKKIYSFYLTDGFNVYWSVYGGQ